MLEYKYFNIFENALEFFLIGCKYLILLIMISL